MSLDTLENLGVHHGNSTSAFERAFEKNRADTSAGQIGNHVLHRGGDSTKKRTRAAEAEST